jgi:tetrahydromethanopterin S-methyltransferase subunit A
VAARVPNEDQIAQEVTQRVARAQEIIEKIDAAKLSRDQREILSSIKDFVTKAREAYQTKDMPRAQVLAEKASRLADDLAAAVKR